ncbi:hypothetical protein D3C87_1266130 [compost metagenome]
MGQRLVAVLDVLNHRERRNALLHQADGHRVVPAQVEDHLNLQLRIMRNIADPPFFLCDSNLVVVNCPCNSRLALAFPNVLVLGLRQRRLGVQPLLLQHLGEPRVVRVVHVHDQRVIGLVRDEPVVCLVCLQLWVERQPDLGTILANRRDQHRP